MADARRLVELGMVPELAKELARQIDEAVLSGGVTQVQMSSVENRLTAVEANMSDTLATDQSE